MTDRNPCKQLKNNQFYSSFMLKKSKKLYRRKWCIFGEYFQYIIDSGTVTSGSSWLLSYHWAIICAVSLEEISELATFQCSFLNSLYRITSHFIEKCFHKSSLLLQNPWVSLRAFLWWQAWPEVMWSCHHGDRLQRVEVWILPGEPNNAIWPQQVLSFQRVVPPLMETRGSIRLILPSNHCFFYFIQIYCYSHNFWQKTTL